MDHREVQYTITKLPRPDRADKARIKDLLDKLLREVDAQPLVLCDTGKEIPEWINLHLPHDHETDTMPIEVKTEQIKPVAGPDGFTHFTEVLYDGPLLKKEDDILLRIDSIGAPSREMLLHALRQSVKALTEDQHGGFLGYQPAGAASPGGGSVLHPRSQL